MPAEDADADAALAPPEDDATDLLALGFSSIDSIGHDYGPNSRELLDGVMRLDRELGGSFGSVRGTLRHLLWGELGWLHYWHEREFPDGLSPSDFADLPSIVAGWKSLEEEKASFVSELTEEKLLEPCPVDDDPYVLSELIQNILVHSTHHRGQVVHMLRQLGRTPPDTGVGTETERRAGGSRFRGNSASAATTSGAPEVGVGSNAPLVAQPSERLETPRSRGVPQRNAGDIFRRRRGPGTRRARARGVSPVALIESIAYGLDLARFVRDRARRCARPSRAATPRR